MALQQPYQIRVSGNGTGVVVVLEVIAPFCWAGVINMLSAVAASMLAVT
jgi:hypothetical protein